MIRPQNKVNGWTFLNDKRQQKASVRKNHHTDFSADASCRFLKNSFIKNFIKV